MKRIGQLIVIIISFVAATIGLDILAGMVLTDNALGLALLGNYPGTEAIPDLTSRYMAYMGMDTLGWATNLFLTGTQNLELIGSTIVYGNATGYIPILMEYHFVSYPQVSIPYMFGVLKLIVPILMVGLVSGWVAKSKKEAMVNALTAMVIIGVIGISLNIVHVIMNWSSADWKFAATLQLNDVYRQILTGPLDIPPGLLGLNADLVPTYYIIASSIVAFAFTVINGAIMAIVAALAALKK